LIHGIGQPAQAQARRSQESARNAMLYRTPMDNLKCPSADRRVMDPLLIALIGFFTLGTTTVIWWLVQVETQMRHVRQETAHLREILRVDLTSLRDDLDCLKESAMALRRTHPAVDGVLEAHATLDALEASLSRADASSSGGFGMSDHASELLSGLRRLLSSVGGDGDLTTAEPQDESIVAVFERFLGFSELVGLSPHDLALDDLELRRLGVISNAAGRRRWTEACFLAAAKAAPGVKATQCSLARLARDAGDEIALRSALEALLLLNPDDEELLREHAALLARHGDGDAERDVRRLAAMGVDNANDRSLLSGIRSRAGDSDAALIEIETALSQDSSNPADWLTKAALLAAKGDVRGALDAVDAALDIDRSCGPAWAARARLLNGIDARLEEALKAAVHAVALGESEHVLKADLLIRSDRTEDAYSSLASALDERPSDAHIRAHLSWLHLMGGDPQVAQHILIAAPDDSWHASAELHIQQGRLRLHHADARRDGTGEHDTSLLTEALESFDAALGVDREDGLGWLGRARCLRQMGDLEEATTALHRSQRLLPEEPMVAIEEALLNLDLGRLDDAALLVKQAAGGAADRTVVEYVKALVAAQRGQLGEARRSFERVLDADPGHVRARLNRCSVSMLLADMHLALDDANELLVMYPDLDIARLRRCEILMTLGDWAEAERDIRNLLDRKPHHSPALTHLGRTLAALGRLDEALPYLDEAIRIDQTLAEGWYQRGLYYLENGTMQAALDDFEATVRADPEHLDALLHAAAIHHESEDLGRAADAWRRVLDMVPEHQLARVRLTEVQTRLTTEVVVESV